MIFTNKFLLFASVVVLASCSEAPGVGVGFDFFPQDCEDIVVTDVSEGNALGLSLRVIGNPVEGDLFMEQQVLAYIKEQYPNRILRGGSALWACHYLQIPCVSLSIFSNSTVNGHVSGSDISDLFIINNNTDDFWFDSDKKLIGSLPSWMPVAYFLSKHPMMLESFKLTSESITPTMLAGSSIFVSVGLGDNRSFTIEIPY